MNAIVTKNTLFSGTGAILLFRARIASLCFTIVIIVYVTHTMFTMKKGVMMNEKIY